MESTVVRTARSNPYLWDQEIIMKHSNGGAAHTVGGEEGDKQNFKAGKCRRAWCSLQETHIYIHKQNLATSGEATPAPASRLTPD